MRDKKISPSFISDLNKSFEKLEGVGRTSAPPKYWTGTGNYTVNRILSGSFLKGLPQGRITCFAGPSGAGKSFLLGNTIRQAQSEGSFVLVVDSENALDDEYMEKIGVDTAVDYSYASVITIEQAQSVVSSFIKAYRKEYGTDQDAPKVLIGIDSLSMLMTQSELENYQKGALKGDQGQRNKQIKAMLRAFTQDIKELNITMVTTCQVYKNQDPLNGEGVWIIPDAVKYACSVINLVTKLKLRTDGEVEGIRMKCESYKTRFTKVNQNVTVEVPYDTGMDPFNGLLDVAVKMNIVEQKGAWYSIGEEKFQSKNFGNVSNKVLELCEQSQQAFIDAQISDRELDISDDETSSRKRFNKVQEGKEEN